MRALALLLLVASSCSPRSEAANAAPSQASVENAPPLKVVQPYRVKQQGGGLGVFVDEAVVFHRVGDEAEPIWVLERRRRDENVGKVTVRNDWIDGRTCAALATVLDAMGEIPPVAMAGRNTQPRGWVSDTPQVTLIGPPTGGLAGDLVLRRDLSGPVSRWWWASGKALETCWTVKKPYIAGAYDLTAKLSTAQDEVEVMRPY